jgi:hypothetical protein
LNLGLKDAAALPRSSWTPRGWADFGSSTCCSVTSWRRFDCSRWLVTDALTRLFSTTRADPCARDLGGIADRSAPRRFFMPRRR